MAVYLRSLGKMKRSMQSRGQVALVLGLRDGAAPGPCHGQKERAVVLGSGAPRQLHILRRSLAKVLHEHIDLPMIGGGFAQVGVLSLLSINPPKSSRVQILCRRKT
jgi:hypothetical protein